MIDTKLITFLTLLEEKNYSKTAARLYITQPAVTHHIKSLEKEYDISLFKNSKTFELTKAGSMLLEYAKSLKLQEEFLLANMKKQDSFICNLGFTPMVKAMIPPIEFLKQIFYETPSFNAYTYTSQELFEHLNSGKIDFAFIDNSFDPFDYDIVDPNEYDEIDLLYTADVHGAWVGYDEDGNYLSPVFNYDDLNSYRTKLKKNNIKALLVDCGDWSRPCRVYTDYVNTGEMVSATQMNNKDYFASTYGNHEWKWGDPNETINILNQNKSMTACNMFRNGKLVYKPYRTAKIGSKRIGVIGIGYPSPNGQGSYSDGEWTYGDFVFYDGDKLFKQVQKYVDELKAANFDYIVVITHMCKSTYESDGRYKARTDSLIENTKINYLKYKNIFNVFS